MPADRGVAQSGSALGWGPSGRRFKSCLPDVALTGAISPMLGLGVLGHDREIAPSHPSPCASTISHHSALHRSAAADDRPFEHFVCGVGV